MRVEGWEKLLTEYIEQAYNVEFVWGKKDCALWCADWINTCTGKDYAKHWRGRYTTEDELRELLNARQLDSYGDIGDLYEHPVDVKHIMRGDIILHPIGTLGICTGVDSVFITERGVLIEKTHKCLKGWKVN